MNINKALVLTVFLMSSVCFPQEMDALWGSEATGLRAENADRGQLFVEGKYAMFIHWGPYSHFGNKVDGNTYYGISEWIMNRNMADISPGRYKKMAIDFNPERFDAMQIARLAKNAGMKYIIVTAKHHDGFAMYHSKADTFNIVDHTPFDRDPMKELARACQAIGLGFGFYYSHNQDWTFPGGYGGPSIDDLGNPATFDDYFQKKCFPQVKEITSQYGPIVLVWFDTPGNIPRNYAEELVAVVRENQPEAFISGRIGHGLGDYRTLGDMELPNANIEGLWETVDTTNDSWGYAWYDENWKTPKQIIERLITCVARGGTYMLNIGPCGDGTVPERAVKSLEQSGSWIRRYPQVIYGAAPSPWQRALPWGDVTVQDSILYLSVFSWPVDGYLYLPGLKTEIHSADLLAPSGLIKLEYQKSNSWTRIKIPCQPPEKYVSVIELKLAGTPEVDTVWGIDPAMETTILSEFAVVKGANLEKKRWMGKFGEWKSVVQIDRWQPDGSAMWHVDVLEPGDYEISLTYAGQERLVWQVAVEDGQTIRNQQPASQIYQRFPVGWLHFPQRGRYHISVSLLDGQMDSASLKAIHLNLVSVLQ